jgi:hypothetical protein
MPTPSGKELRDAALFEHEQKYGEWLLEARRAAWKWAVEHGSVDADDVHRLTPCPPWVHHNAAGAVFKTPWFRHVGFKNSVRRDARARTIRIYEAVRKGELL